MFLDSGKKTECFGCEACVQACVKKAIRMEEDSEGFRYPVISHESCVECGLCRKVCPFENTPNKHENKYVYGGYHKNSKTRFGSTSGGAFSAIVEAFCVNNYVIFGAEAKGLSVYHNSVEDKKEIAKFRKSKYSQSIIGDTYREVKKALQVGKKVLFSGTPCQVAGLYAFLDNKNIENLLTVEVVCEGVPSPLYIRKLNEHIIKKHGNPIGVIDYRYTGKSILSHGKWDFENMRLIINKGRYKNQFCDNSKNKNEKIVLVKDRWFNPFWSIWLNHLMSRPSCYECKFTTPERVADITLGDLWGVHLYCPELYGKNGGSSLVVCNTAKGQKIFNEAKKYMFGHSLRFEDAIKYQSPLRNNISNNSNRDKFMYDLKSDMDYININKKWYKKPTLKLLFQKYIWGNRQKIFLWEIIRKINIKRG